MSQAEAVLPEARPPYPGNWAPEMAERGLSLFTVRMSWSWRDYGIRVRGCHAYQPLVPTAVLIGGVGEDTGKGPFSELVCLVIAPSGPDAIETALANVRWWIEHEGWEE